MRQPFTIQDLLRIRIPTEWTISPDGCEAVYALRTLDEDKGEYRTKLWRVSLPTFEEAAEPGAEAEAVQITYGPSQEVSPLYSPTGDGIVFLSDRPVSGGDEGSDEDEKPFRLFWLPWSCGEARPVSESLEHIHDFVFHPDGASLFVITDVEQSTFEKERVKALIEQRRDVTHEERVLQPRRICRVELDDGRVTTLYGRDYGLAELDVAPDGRRLVFATNYTGLDNDWDKLDLWLLEAVDGEADARWQARPLVQRKGACHGAKFSPDGRYVAYIAPRTEHSELSQSDVWVVPVDGSQSPYNLSEAAGFVGDAEEVAWVSGDALMVQVERGLYAPLVVFDGVVSAAASGSAPSVRTVAGEREVVRGFVVNAGRQIALYRAEDADTPFELYALQIASGRTAPVTDLQSEWKDRLRADVREFRWVSFDGTEIEGVLVLPPQADQMRAEAADPSAGDPGGDSPAATAPASDGAAQAPGQRPPLILHIHGGPAWHTTRSFSQYLNWHWLAGLGYAVFAPNYRGSIGYGHEFVAANHMDLGGGDYRDIMTGVDAVLQTGLVDPERLGVTGGSYGGYMTNWIIGHDRRFKAAVSEFGIWNLLTDFGCSSSRGWEVMYLGRYWENEALYLERSPARYVTNIETPVLIIHGDADDNTFLSNSKEMYNALVEAGKTVEFVHYPREGHGLREPRHREDELRRIERWFQHYLPTTAARRPVPLGEWGVWPEGRTRFRVDDVQVTDAFARHGEEFKKVIAVHLSWSSEPVPSQPGEDGKPGTGTTSRAKDAEKGDTPRLSIGSPANNDVFLAWYGTEPYQRPSVFARREFEPLGLALPGAGGLLSGDVTFRPDGAGRVVLLFPGRALEFGRIDEFVLLIKETGWLLKA